MIDNYNRIVCGGRGNYVELSKNQILVEFDELQTQRFTKYLRYWYVILKLRNNYNLVHTNSYPHFLFVTAGSRFIQAVEGGYCYIEDGTLVVNWPTGLEIPDTLYVPIFSKYIPASRSFKVSPQQ